MMVDVTGPQPQPTQIGVPGVAVRVGTNKVRVRVGVLVIAG